MYTAASKRLHKAEAIGLKDNEGKDIHEGDILFAPSGFKYIVIWNEYINNFCMLFVSCFKDMTRNPYTRRLYLQDSNPLCGQVIDFWKLIVRDNLDQRPSVLTAESF